ncbi:hypothetical protein D1831_09145 [Lactiplantibacillus garii]|uniref:Uncharacterized protein n=1 Tax=Lactiplantibacillus garii TaxID=2306423 RepID=A0A426D6B5_9LACO|nr:hypothetical protein [Lactiplantibacillus garii]RRK10118.1 hypothetical protein D1831_09145 [Lactiplantibacillus garii]
MNLLINIVPNETISWDRLLQLSAAIEAQRFAGVVTNLQLPANQELTGAHQAKLAALHVTVQEQPQLPTTADGYVLNLRETTGLLPGALAQWQSVTSQHANTPVSLATFDNQLPLDEQINDYLTAHANNGLLRTYQQLSDSDNVWPQLWGLQNYSVQTNLKNFRLLSQRLRPTGVLLPVSQLSPDYPVVSLAQNLQLLSQQTEIIRLHVPTIQNGSWSRDTPLAWFNQLQLGQRVTLNAEWEPVFEKYYRSQLKRLLKHADENQLTEAQQDLLRDQLEQVPVLDAHH